MKGTLYAHDCLTSLGLRVWLWVSVLLLSACQSQRQSAAGLMLPPTPRPSPTPTASPTPPPLSSLWMVTPPPLPAFSLEAAPAFEQSGTILFSGGLSAVEGTHLYLIAAQGGEAACLTCSLGAVLEQNGYYTAPRFDSPAWAPDGQRLAFVFRSVQRNSILLSDRQGSLQELCASRDDWYADLTWSPAGSALAFSTGPLAGREYGASLICVLRLDQPAESEPLCTAAGRANRFPAWSPEADRIIFSSGEGPYRPDGRPMDLFIWDLESRTLRRLTETSGESETAARWSPDGTRLAYIVHVRLGLERADSSLWLADASGQRAASLPATADIRAFGWSPDGRRIVFARLSPEGDPSGGPSAMQLVLLDMESGSLSVLVEGQPWLDRPDWQPAGKD